MSRAIRVSVVVPAHGAAATLPIVLGALRPQVTDDAEVIVVDSSGAAPAAALQAAHPWLEVIAPGERTSPGRARNLGAAHARGSRLAFLDADAVPGPRWLARLTDALDGGGDATVAVAGSVANGTPRHPVGTAGYLLEFSDWTPRRRGPLPHGAGCNLLVGRDALEAAGGFPEDLWPGEDTVLTVPWAHAGRLGFARTAAVRHLNRTAPGEFLAHQRRLGGAFAAACDRVELPAARFGRWPWLAFAPGPRAVAVARRLTGDPALLAGAAALSPLLALGLDAWTAGVIAARRRAPARA